MLVRRAYKTELHLNNRQVTACRQHAGAARWAYNWGLQRKYEVSKCAPQEALWNLDAAFQQFFRHCPLSITRGAHAFLSMVTRFRTER
jgi:hypothetical protein